MTFRVDLTKPIQRPVVPNYEDPEVLQAETFVPQTIAAKPVANPAPEIDPQQYLGGLLNQAPPAPKYSQNSEKDLLNMAKTQKIGEFFQLLGDVYGVAKGAPVPVRNITSSAPYLQKIIENREKYRQQKQDYDYKEYVRKLQNAAAMAKQNQDWKKFEAAQAFKEKQFGATQGLKERQFDVDTMYKSWLVANGQEDNDLSRDKFDESIRQFGITSGQRDRQIGISAERNQIAKEKADKTTGGKTGKPFTEAEYKGQRIPIYEGEYRNLLEAGLRREGKGETDIKQIMARYQHQPTEEYKQIAVKEKVKQLEEQDIANSPIQPFSPYGPGPGSSTAAPASTTKVPKAFAKPSPLLY